MDVTTMYDERKKLVDAMRTLLEYYGDKALSAEDREKHDKMEARYGELTEQITRANALAEREAEEKRLDKPVTRTLETAEPAAAQQDEREKRYAAAFDTYVRDKQSGMEPELRASTDPQLVGTDASGGYSVPNQWYSQFQETRKEANIMRQLATIISSKSGTMRIVKEDTEGVAAWYDENASIAVAQETITYVDFLAYKMGRIITVSNELLHDSMFNISAYLMRKLARSMGVLEEAAFVNGDGTYPEGIFNAATSGVTSASATAITADELITLYHSVSEEYRRDGVWLMKDSTVKLIRQLKTGDQQYLWQPGLQAGQPDKILGKTMYTSSNAPAATAALKSVLFGYTKGFWIVDRVGLAMQRLDELYAVNDLIGFKGTARTDSGLVDTSSVRVITMHA